MGFADYNIALEIRDFIRGLVNTEIEKIRPRHQMAQVTSIDRVQRKASVQFVGEAASVTVNMGSIQPSSVGQYVRVDGVPGDRYIADVMGPHYIDASVGINMSSDFTSYGFQGRGGEQFNWVSRFAGGVMMGGGLRDWDGTTATWTERIMPMGGGRNPNAATSGYMDILMPADGTVIPRYGIAGGGQDSVTALGGVPMGPWNALYVEPALPGNSAAAGTTKFRLVDYLSNFTVPAHWIFICAQNSTRNSLFWWDGYETAAWRYPTMTNGWTDYGSPYGLVKYRRSGNEVRLAGLAKNGSSSTTATGNIFVLNTGHRPGSRQIITTTTNPNVAARLDILPDGSVRSMNGDPGWISLENITFFADL